MRALLCWDDAEQAELISLYLNSGEGHAESATDPAEMFKLAEDHRGWDVILLSSSLPDFDGAYGVFEGLRRRLPDCPIVGACRSDDVFRIAKFLTNGMRAYLIRDDAGDFVFLLQSTLESTIAAVEAERERQISERLREEIESVRKLQESIIPHDLQSPDGYDVCARYESSQIRVLGGQPVIMAGGDYYDVFMLGNDQVVLLLGDASGHGMKACMSIMTMHTLIGMIRGEAYRDTASFVSEVNQRLCGQQIVSDDGGFITLLFGILNAQTHEFQWTSAGHPMPLLQDLSTGKLRPLGGDDAGGLPLGIIPDADYDHRTDVFPPNSRLLLYTDGLAEAFPAASREHREFGMEGIEATLMKTASSPPHDALQALFDDSTAYTAGAGRHDDTSAVIVDRK